jgi:nucleoside-diphosphate-sugar epimerase
MRVLLAGATGAIGHRLVPLLLGAGHDVTGTTRSVARGRDLEQAGVRPAIVDFFDASAVLGAFRKATPDVVIHQLTDLPRELDQARLAKAYAGNARLRIEGTRNLITAAQAVSARRLIVQSIAFAYAPGREPHPETDALNLADPVRAATVKGAAEMERQVLAAAGLEGIVLRYGLLYGPSTWFEAPGRKPGLHVDAAAHAALLAITRGTPGIYNIADDDGVVSIAKARATIGFDPQFRLSDAAAHVPLSQNRDARVSKV